MTPTVLGAIIDTDPGLDDLLALAFALASPELRVEAITTVAGNASLQAVTRNALGLLALAEQAIPVGRGASAPLVAAPVRAEHIHGADGRGGLALPEPRVSPEPDATELLRSRLGQGDAARLIAIGPLTNVARALERAPDLLRRAELVWMGGTLGRGNATPLAEFNAHADPQAASAVLRSGARMRVVGLEVTQRVGLRPRDLAPFGPEPFGSSPRGRLLQGVTERLMEVERPHTGETLALLHDPCAVAAAFAPELFRWELRALDVLSADAARGRLVERKGEGGVLLAVDVRAQELVRTFLGRLRRWAGAAESATLPGDAARAGTAARTGH